MAERQLDAHPVYASEYFWPNLLNFSTWLVRTQTPFICLGIAAPLFFHRRGDSEAHSIAVLSLGFSVMVVASYLWYTPYGDWTYLRFLLPAFPLMLALAASVFLLVAAGGPRRQMAAVAAVAATLALWAYGPGVRLSTCDFCWPASACTSTPFRPPVTACALDAP